MFFESLSTASPELQAQVTASLGKLGAALAISLAAVGSALGTGAAGITAITAWKKCYAQNKMAPFMLVAFVGAPLTQTIYGMIVMNGILKVIAEGPVMYHNLLVGGLAAGLAIGMSAWMQGRAGARASDALAETGKGFVNYLMVLGIIETVALFVMVFIAGALK
jgi:V/A-type H+-transporting ATPase subunit K